MNNVKTIKDRKYIKLAFEVSQLQQQADLINAALKDKKQELKAFNADKLPAQLLTVPFTIVNGFTHETVCSQTVQNRSQYAVDEICQDLGVKALTVENGYKYRNPVMCLKVGNMSKTGF